MKPLISPDVEKILSEDTKLRSEFLRSVRELVKSERETAQRNEPPPPPVRPQAERSAR